MRERAIIIMAALAVAALADPTPIPGGANDAGFDGESWVSNSTTLTASASSSAWLQFDLYLPRNTAIQSATLTVVPSATSLIVPNLALVAFAPLFDGDLATDRSAMLGSLDGESEVIIPTWTAGEPEALDVTEAVQAWIVRPEVPEDDSGAFCTLVIRIGAMDPSTYSMAAFEHATLAAATLTIEAAPVHQFAGESGLHYAPAGASVQGETGLHFGGESVQGESGLHYRR